MKCEPGKHAWVAGMMVVDNEDVLAISELRSVECEKCEYKVSTSFILTPEGVHEIYGDE